LAQALARTGARDAARAEQQEVERINAARAAGSRALVLLSDASQRARAGDREGAIVRLREAVGLAPTLAEAQYQLGAALRELPGRGAESAAALAEAVRLEPAHASAHYQLGVVLAAGGDVPGAIAALRRATDLAPGLVAAQRELAALARRQQDPTLLAAALTAIVAWDPHDTAAAGELRHLSARASKPQGPVK
jgi:tetratricopeptide (TPR) repeat protein